MNVTHFIKANNSKLRTIGTPRRLFFVIYCDTLLSRDFYYIMCAGRKILNANCILLTHCFVQEASVEARYFPQKPYF